MLARHVKSQSHAEEEESAGARRADLRSQCQRLRSLLTTDDAGDTGAMYAGSLEFLIDMELGYDLGEDGLCTPTAQLYDDPADEATQVKVAALYGQAMNMLYFAGPETSAKIKEVVLEKLARRLGMDGVAFDEWALPLLV